MKKVLIVIIPVAIILSFFYCDKGSDPPQETKTVEDLLPVNNGVSGWVIDPDSTCEWIGAALSEDDLWVLIDGAAPVFVNNGFKEAAFQGYSDGTGIICVQIYNQSSNSNALTVFKHDDIASGSAYSTIDNLGDTARIETTEYILDVVKGQYFMRLELKTTGSDYYKQQMITMVNHIIGKM
jgi:hypothetical protein